MVTRENFVKIQEVFKLQIAEYYGNIPSNWLFLICFFSSWPLLELGYNVLRNSSLTQN